MAAGPEAVTAAVAVGVPPRCTPGRRRGGGGGATQDDADNAGPAAGGGGGSSSAVDPDATFTTDTTGDPSVTISYTVEGPPSVTITTPPNNASYADGQTVDANYGCTAGTNATLKSCAGPVDNGSPINTSTVGSGQSFTVTATDTDGQSASVTSSYTVTALATSLTAAPQIDLRAWRSAVGLGLVSATLTNGGEPLSGQTITFTDGSVRLCSEVTSVKGIATCRIPLRDEVLVLLTNRYTATYAATTDYTGATATTAAIVR